MTVAAECFEMDRNNKPVCHRLAVSEYDPGPRHFVALSTCSECGCEVTLQMADHHAEWHAEQAYNLTTLTKHVTALAVELMRLATALRTAAATPTPADADAAPSSRLAPLAGEGSGTHRPN